MTRPTDDEIARNTSPPPRLLDVRHGERAQPCTLGREGPRHHRGVARRPAGRTDAPVPREAEIRLGDGQGGDGTEDYVPHLVDFVARANGSHPG